MGTQHISLALVGIVVTATAFSQRSASEAAYEQLAREDVYVHSAMSSKVNLSELQSAAAKAAPMKAKIVVVPALRGRWVSNGRETRGSYAKWLLSQRLTLKNAVVIVATNRGITAYSDRVSERKLAELSNESLKLATPASYTAAIVSLVDSVERNASSSASAAPLATTSSSRFSGSLFSSVWALLGLAAVADIVIWGIIAAGCAKKLRLAREMTKELRGQVVDGIGYLDSYADLLPAGENADAVRQYRQAAEAKYMQAASQIDKARQPQEVDQAKLYLSQALNDIERAKQHIEAATDGSKVAYSIDNTGAAELPSDGRSAQIYEPVANTCFFCSYPGKGDLTPVTLAIDGQKRTVLACPNDLASLRAGSPPSIRSMRVDGQPVPWYRVPGYDPNVSYNDRSFVWDMVGMYAMASLLNPFAFGYPGYGGHHVVNNYYGDPSPTDTAFDPSSSQPDMAELDSSGDFVGSDAGDFGADAGDFGGDFGGGDFGGGDF